MNIESVRRCSVLCKYVRAWRLLGNVVCVEFEECEAAVVVSARERERVEAMEGRGREPFLFILSLSMSSLCAFHLKGRYALLLVALLLLLLMMLVSLLLLLLLLLLQPFSTLITAPVVALPYTAAVTALVLVKLAVVAIAFAVTV